MRFASAYIVGRASFGPIGKEDTVLLNTTMAVHTDPARGTGIDDPGEMAAQTCLLDAVLASLEDDKAEDVAVIDLRGRTEVADHMVVASGRSSRQVIAISEKLAERLKQGRNVAVRIEGKDQGDWVLLDAGDVIVHVFRPEVREFYQIEKMWAGTPPGAAAPRG